MGGGEKEAAKGKHGQSLNRKPAREFRASVSADGKYWIFRDTTTWFIPVNYLSAIHRGHLSKLSGGDGKAPGKDEGNGGKIGRTH